MQQQEGGELSARQIMCRSPEGAAHRLCQPSTIRDPSLSRGPPTAVNVEPAPHGVLPKDVLRLADILPRILHLHFVELQSGVLSGFGRGKRERGVSQGRWTLSVVTSKNHRGCIGWARRKSLRPFIFFWSAGDTLNPGTGGDLNPQDNTSSQSTHVLTMNSHIFFLGAGFLCTTFSWGKNARALREIMWPHLSFPVAFAIHRSRRLSLFRVMF